MLAKLSRYDEGTLFSSFLSFTVSKELLSFPDLCSNSGLGLGARHFLCHFGLGLYIVDCSQLLMYNNNTGK